MTVANPMPQIKKPIQRIQVQEAASAKEPPITGPVTDSVVNNA